MASCDKLRRAACKHWTVNVRICEQINAERQNNAGNWSILVPAGEEKIFDTLSSSERKGHRANWIFPWKRSRDVVGYYFFISELNFSGTKGLRGWKPRKLNWYEIFLQSSTSWIGGVNTAELTANPKYWFKSDSVLVPRGKAEKYS